MLIKPEVVAALCHENIARNERDFLKDLPFEAINQINSERI